MSDFTFDILPVKDKGSIRRPYHWPYGRRRSDMLDVDDFSVQTMSDMEECEPEPDPDPKPGYPTPYAGPEFDMDISLKSSSMISPDFPPVPPIPGERTTMAGENFYVEQVESPNYDRVDLDEVGFDGSDDVDFVELNDSTFFDDSSDDVDIEF